MSPSLVEQPASDDKTRRGHDEQNAPSADVQTSSGKQFHAPNDSGLSSRQRAVLTLQRTQGNHAVRRLMDSGDLATLDQSVGHVVHQLRKPQLGQRVQRYTPSAVRQNFTTAVQAQHWAEAFTCLNGLNMFEMLRALAALDPAVLDAMWANSAGASGLNLPRMDYAKNVVRNRALPAVAPGDLQQTGQVTEAQNFLSQTSTRDVDQSVSETISNAPAAYAAWNGTFGWKSRFSLFVDRAAHTLSVIVRINSSATAAQKSSWESAIESKWSNRFTLVVAGAAPTDPVERYPITVDLQWSNAANAHYNVAPNNPGATASGRAGLGGTISMTGWGTSDTVDITHEFGHMLGNPEEYFTTNGVDYTGGGTRTGFRDTGGGVMNNPGEAPAPRHFNLIRQQAAATLGVPEARCTVS